MKFTNSAKQQKQNLREKMLQPEHYEGGAINSSDDDEFDEEMVEKMKTRTITRRKS